MLSKEEIEFNLKALSGVMLNFEDRLCDEMQERVKEVKEYIDNLESDKQKLIEKLEEDKETLKKENADGTLQDYVIKLLEILKGENQVIVKQANIVKSMFLPNSKLMKEFKIN